MLPWSGLAAAASIDPKRFVWLNNSSGNSICNSFEAQCKIVGTVYFGALLKKKKWKFELLKSSLFNHEAHAVISQLNFMFVLKLVNS